MEKSVAWMANNHVAANLLMVFVLLSGFIAMMSLKRETFPEFSLDQVQVQVPYLGASPEEVEEGVTRRIEERLSGLEGVRRIRSTSAEGMALVTVEVELGADLGKVQDDIKNEIDRIETFPAETEKPVIKEMVRRNRVIEVAVYGEVSEKALKVAAERVRDDLRAQDLISQVEMSGVRADEISIEVSEYALRRHGLTLERVRQAVQRASLDLPGGSVRGEDGEILVRTKGLKYSGVDYEDIAVLTRPDGTQVKLGQIARVVDGFEDSDLVARFNGQAAAVVQVYRIGEQNALEISDFVKQYVAEQERLMPAGIGIDYVRDDARLLRSRLDLLLRNAQLGLGLVFICLSLFLNLRLAFWVMMGIPISFLCSFLLMQPFDVSINMLSLFAFIVALGIVVDDAIIVGENIFAHRERGKNRLQAAIDGTLEVGTPVIFSIMTSVAAFMPLIFVGGMMGKFMKIIPIIVISVLVASLIEALYILPAHLSSQRNGGGGGGLFGWHARLSDWFGARLKHFIDRYYSRTVQWSVTNPLSSAAVGVALMLITVGWMAGGHIKFVMFPQIESDWLVASVAMPEGTTAGQTQEVIERIERAALAVRDEIDRDRGPGHPSIYSNVFSIIGDQPMGRRSAMNASGAGFNRGHLGEVTVELLPSEERSISSAQIEARVRRHLGEVPGTESLTLTSTLFSFGKAIEVQLAHEDFSTLLQAVERFKAEIANYPGTGDIQDSFQAGKLEMKLALKPQARTLGLTLADLGRQVRQGFYGGQALRLQRGSDDVRVMVRYPEGERRSLSDIENMRVRTPGGTEVPFSQVAEVELGRGYASIQRSDGRRIVTVSATVDQKAVNAEEINRALADNFLPQLGRDYPGLRFSFEGEQREQAESMATMGRGFIIALFAIFALLAVPFRSYSQPLVVMSAIPFGIIGAVWGHVLMGLDLTMLSMFGMVALSGVVVNDSLVLITFYNQLVRDGMERNQALVEAGKQRFRPILLTSLTTFFGLLPMILEKSVQAQFLIPMAVSLGFGILFATGIILVGVPTSMKMLISVQDFFGRLLQGKEEPAVVVETGG